MSYRAASTNHTRRVSAETAGDLRRLLTLAAGLSAEQLAALVGNLAELRQQVAVPARVCALTELLDAARALPIDAIYGLANKARLIVKLADEPPPQPARVEGTH